MSRMKIAARLTAALGILLLPVEEPGMPTARSWRSAERVRDRMAAAGPAAARTVRTKLASPRLRAMAAGRRWPALIVV